MGEVSLRRQVAFGHKFKEQTEGATCRSRKRVFQAERAVHVKNIAC
jgi:hypothetical protein